MLIGLRIWGEVSYDNYFENKGRIAQIITTQTFSGHTNTHPAIAIPLANELRIKHGGSFKLIAHTSWNFDFILVVGNKEISQKGSGSYPVKSLRTE